jgi:hypothetical protein
MLHGDVFVVKNKQAQRGELHSVEVDFWSAREREREQRFKQQRSE